MAERPHCVQQAACAAKGAGHCRSCHMAARNRSDAAREAVAARNCRPEMRTIARDRLDRQRLDPAFAGNARAAACRTMEAINLRRARRISAREAVRAAGLPMLKATIDDVAAHLARGATLEMALLAAQPQAADRAPWRPWQGRNAAPIALSTPVRVRGRDGSEDRGRAGDFNWLWLDMPDFWEPDDIVAFQVQRPTVLWAAA